MSMGRFGGQDTALQGWVCLQRTTTVRCVRRASCGRFDRPLPRRCELEWPGMTAEQLTIHTRAGRGTGQRILDVAGRLDLSTSLTFLEQIRVETAPVVILDMARVDYVDSSGVGAIAQIQKSFQLEHRRLALVGLTPRVRQALEITHVLKMLTVFATASEAANALTSHRPDSGQAS